MWKNAPKLASCDVKVLLKNLDAQPCACMRPLTASKLNEIV